MMTNHPDIEIYIKNTRLSSIVDWLSARFEQFEPTASKGMLHQYEARWQQQRFAVAIHERALGKSWISVWFQSAHTPWQIDLECAREASEKLHAQVRCIASGWQEGDDPDEWWRVEKGQETKIQWVTD